MQGLRGWKTPLSHTCNDCSTLQSDCTDLAEFGSSFWFATYQALRVHSTVQYFVWINFSGYKRIHTGSWITNKLFIHLYRFGFNGPYLTEGGELRMLAFLMKVENQKHVFCSTSAGIEFWSSWQLSFGFQFPTTVAKINYFCSAITEWNSLSDRGPGLQDGVTLSLASRICHTITDSGRHEQNLPALIGSSKL